jgi:3-hydroxyisobutyrate dehydrogenase
LKYWATMPRPNARLAAGARAATSIAEVIRFADVVLLSLPDSKVVEAVVEGTDGILASCREGQTVIDLSTAAASSTIRLNALFKERGVQYIDAGISGGAAAAAEKGTLTLMVGGDAAAIEAIQWVFKPIATKAITMGESGAGHTTKLLNNFLNAVSLSATAEVMVAGKKAGLDLHRLLDVLNSSSGVNFATQNRFPKIVDGDYLEGGLTAKLMTKDVVLYIDRVRELGVSSLNSSGPLASFGLATALGYGDMISNRVVDAIGDVSGGIRLKDVHEFFNGRTVMKVFRGRAEGAVSEQRSATFSGVVWADSIMPTTDKVTIANVFFSPGARTFWHTHEQGQILQVTSGSGFVCVDGGEPQAIRTGDVVWIPANERHWHGAGRNSYMVHTATSLGKTMWEEEVAEAVYQNAVG